MSKLTKSAQIARVVKSRIVRGAYPERVPTDRDLAREFGVSRVTIRTALASLAALGVVTPQPRQGTRVNLLARVGTGRAPALVRIVCPAGDEMIAPWMVPVMRGFGKAASSRGLETILKGGGVKGDRASFVQDLLLSASEPNLIGSCLMTTLEKHEAVKLAVAPTPFVLADCDLPTPTLCCVTFDDRKAGALAAERLLKMGHRKIAYIDMLPEHPNRTTRRKAAEEGIAQVGGSLCKLFDLSLEQVAQRVTELLREPNRPTAIICGVTAFADVVVDVARVERIVIPRDLSVVIIGETEDSAREWIDHIAMDYEGMGRRALRLLLDEDALVNPRREVVDVWLVTGRSVGPAPAP